MYKTACIVVRLEQKSAHIEMKNACIETKNARIEMRNARTDSLNKLFFSRNLKKIVKIDLIEILIISLTRITRLIDDFALMIFN